MGPFHHSQTKEPVLLVCSSLILQLEPAKHYPSLWNLSGATHWETTSLRDNHSPDEEALVRSLTTQSPSTNPLSSLVQESGLQTWVPAAPSNIKEIPQASPLLPMFPQCTAPRGAMCLDAARSTASWTLCIGYRVKKDICHKLSQPWCYIFQGDWEHIWVWKQKTANKHSHLALWSSFQERFLKVFSWIFNFNPQCKFHSEEVILWLCDLQNYLLPAGASGEVHHLLYAPLPSDTDVFSPRSKRSVCKAGGNYTNSTIHEMYQNTLYA